MPRKLTITDIARHLGIGRSTVQRALSNDPHCRTETREKVLRTAKRLGYRPDPVFAALGSRQTRRSSDAGTPIAYLVGRSGGVGIHDLLTGRARELGYTIHRIDLTTWESPGRLWPILHSRGYAGVLAGVLTGRLRELMLDNDRFPLVCVGRGEVDPPFNTVRPAILSSVQQAWERMWELGYRRIGAAILSHDPVLADDFSRLAAVTGCQAQAKRPEAAIPPLREPIGGDMNAVVGWVRRHRPDAVLGFHTGLCHLLRSAGIRIPEDLGFACLHNDRAGLESKKPREIAGMTQNFPAIARGAVNLLDQMIRHGECGVPASPVTITVQSLWSEGRSLPPRG